MSEPLRHVLVVEDDSYIADAIGLGLRQFGFTMTHAASGQQALEACARSDPDLIVLDIMLPDIDGLALCRLLRGSGSDVPVLFLTARDSTADTVAGLRAGGDDYMTKPFSTAELALRIRAILRRIEPPADAINAPLSYADLTVDPAAREARRGSRTVELSATECSLLCALLSHAEQVLTRDALLEAVWRDESDVQPGVLGTYISYLRRKLDPLGPPLIHTVRGVGYILRLNEPHSEV
ncbi:MULTISPECIES: response regulator transcription factor [unclassified Streptomyces]|uniref:response regulator transcription factor n=1 Tax=unclassified Streptomyces TaxID=2593676 RepID=UPI003817A9CC